MKFLIATENARVRAQLKQLYAPVRLVFVTNIHTYLQHLNTETYNAIFLDTVINMVPRVNFCWVTYYGPMERNDRNKTTPLYFLNPTQEGIHDHAIHC